MPKSCTCGNCVRACSRKPGWFLPGEAEKLAAAMGLSLQELFNKHLIADYWARYPEEDILVLAPNMQGFDRAIASWGFYGKPCTFLKDSRCTIHDLGKPYECRLLHGDEPEDLDHHAVARAWLPHQDLIKQLIANKEALDA